ncbi:MAG: outer membrane beta-barrel protein [Candidatus Glassbacteria bacterium]
MRITRIVLRELDSFKAEWILAFFLLLFFATTCLAFDATEEQATKSDRFFRFSRTFSLLETSPKPGSPLFNQIKERGLSPDEEEVQTEKKFRLALGIGGNMPRRDLGDSYETGTLVELFLGYHILKYIQVEGGLGYTTGFLKGEGIVGFDAATGRIIELRGSYIALPLGLKLIKGFRNDSMNFSIGSGFLYNRYAQNLNLIDIFGLASRQTESRSGFGYYANSSYEHFFSSQYGIGARVRYVTTRTSGENVGGVLTGEGEDYDPQEEGKTRDAWLTISAALLYRF